MSVSPAEIVQVMQRPRYRPGSVGKLLSTLNLTKDSLDELKRHVSMLEAAGVVEVRRGGAVGLRKGARFAIGVIGLTRKGVGFLTQDVAGAPDVYIGRRNLGTAGDDDRVLVELTGRRRYRGRLPSGKVVLVLKRARERIIGTLQRWRHRTYVVSQAFGPDREIQIPKGKTQDAEPGQRVLVRLGDRHDRLTGVVERVLGSADDASFDRELIVAEFDLPGAFPEKVIEEARGLPQTVGDKEAEGRTDLRDELIITIDPEDAKDFDDAISLKRVGGRWELGVHIADVSHFVRPGGAIWTEAIRRGTSVYLPGHTIHMLPETLSADVCSLRPGVPRLTKSVFMTFDDDGQVRKVRLLRSVIRSAERLTYEQAAEAIEGKADGLSDDVVSLLRDANALAKRLNQVRMSRGALELELPEVDVQVDESGSVTFAGVRERLDSHRLIEECMIAANEAVARTMAKRGLPVLSRVHEEPDERDLHELFGFARTLGVKVGNDRSRRGVQKLLLAVKDTPLEYAVHLVALRSLKRAHYTSKLRGHYALASSDYCHFTSPIRRFPDLIVGAVLDEGVFKCGARRFDPDAWERDLEGWAIQSGELERRAEAAERDLTKLKLLRALGERDEAVMMGTVVGVQAFGAFVELDEVPVEGLMRLHDLSDDYYSFDERAKTLTGDRRGRRIALGQRLRVRVDRIDLERRELNLLPVGRIPR